MSIGIGDALREAREAQGRTLQDASQSLRVRSDHVDALENERFEVFGADTYARGHLRNYAAWLGLDTDELVGLYDRYVRTDDQTAHHIADAPVSLQSRDPLPQWVLVLGAGVAVLAAVALIGLLGDRTPPPAEMSIADEASPTPSPTTTTASPDPTTEPSPTPSDTPTFDGVEMLLVVESRCYLEITMDGQQTHQRSGQTLEAGETVEVRAEETITVRYGNAGGVIVEVNDQSYGRPGGNAQVVEITYGPDGPVTDPAA